MTATNRLCFIGGGVMAEAIMSRVLSGGVARKGDITVGEALELRRKHLNNEYGIETVSKNLSAIKDANIIIIAVKPQQIEEVCQELRGHIETDQTILSIAAGIKIGRIQEFLGHDNIIRVMPNTPAQIGQGMSVWTNTKQVSEANLTYATQIIKSLGEELYVAEEKYLDIATALSASGPAYVFVFLESLIDAGVYLGLTRQVANKLAIQTVLGSATLARDENKHIAELRNMVTSPGGTTAEALLALETGGFRGVVIDAVISAYNKSLALGGD